METKTISNTELHSLIVGYDLHTQIFSNLIDGISKTNAHNLFDTPANHILRIITELVQKRYDLANETGLQLEPKASAFYNDHQDIPDNIIYPLLNEFKKDWEKITSVLRDALLNLNDDQLNSFCSIERPDFDTDTSLLGAIGFFIYLETYKIGQISLWQSYWGNSGKNFDEHIIKMETDYQDN